jgi:ABC-2 type transport system permease protein
MGNLLTIYRRECASYFNSAIAYIVIIVFLMAMSFFYFLVADFFGRPPPDFRPYFENLLAFGFFSLIVSPAITMRLWSEEKKQGTIELLMTLPLRSWEIVLGKFLAAYTVIAVTILLTVAVPISVGLVVEGLDWGAIGTLYAGVFLISAVYIALGACVSAFTQNQIVAFMASVLLSAAIFFMGIPPVIKWANESVFNGLGTFFGQFGTFFHFQNFAKGLFSLVDVVYALSLTIFFILINNVAVEGRKY